MSAVVRAEDGPGTLEVLSLLTEVVDELVVRSARDTHLAVLDRVDRVLDRAEMPRRPLHRTVATGVYDGVGAGFRVARRGLDALGRTPLAPGPGMLAGPRGRAVHATVNGLIGDRLARDRPAWTSGTTVRHDGRVVAPEPARLREAFPDASARVVVLVHGWCEDESCWDRQAERLGPGYADTLEREGWTPVRVRLNTGLDLRANGRALARLMGEVVAAWPVPVTRVAFVGHSMGGLVVRAATSPPASDAPWTQLVTDVVTLGTPHLGAPLAAVVDRGSAGLGRLPETRPVGRVLDWRSAGVRDLVRGLDTEVPPLPHVRYRLVAGTVTGSAGHPVGRVLGDVLVRPGSAYGRSVRVGDLFAGADVLHLPSTHHLALLNHPRVHEALSVWLA